MGVPRLPLPDSLYGPAHKQWQRFETAVNQCLELSESQRQDLLDRTRTRSDLLGVWACSDFISQSCIARPTLLKQIIDSQRLEKSSDHKEIVNTVRGNVGQCDNEVELHSRLRKIRQRMMVQIAWRDLASYADVEETMECVSALAEISIQLALEYHQKWLLEKYGEPEEEGTGNPSKFIVLGLGKLGGSELNYSSDVDLMFAYSGTGATKSGRSENIKSLDNQEYFVRLGRKIVAALDPVTEHGFVFRTDLRLRPNGDSGPLVLSFAAMEHYYQTHGRTWERYALVKARVVVGDRELGLELLSMLRPFVYRKYLDFGAFDSIREMKAMIQRELKQKGSDQNIKLGWGGIREIEFLVQSYQLIRGGRDKRLQTNSLYQAIFELVELQVLDVQTQKQLLEAYRFLRNTEHRLQMVADRQTQLLPEDDLGRQRLAWSMDYDNWLSFSEALRLKREEIHNQFRTILEAPDTENSSSADTAIVDTYKLSDVWAGSHSDAEVTQLLADLGFDDSNSTPQLLSGFRNGRLYQAFSGVERDRIDRLMPKALIEAATHVDSQRAMASFISILEAIGRRTAYLSLLIENPIALTQLVHLCAASPWVSSHIGQHPVILDELLHPILDVRDRTARDLENELDQRLVQLEENDDEGRLNELREFHHAQVLRIAAADISNVLEVEEIHRALTTLAEVLVQRVFDDAVDYVSRKLVVPNCEAGVIAYGKFASGELGYHSDLDLVVCFQLVEISLPGDHAEAEHFFSRVGRRFIHLLSIRTHAGLLYEIDTRLRPSGRSGTLVTSLKGFFDYQQKSAWTWEHQALVRARAVVGSEGFRLQFEQARKDIVCLDRKKGTLRVDILDMRRKMIDANCQSTDKVYDIKLDEGGIVDIEFLIQYWVLRHANLHSDLTKPRNTEETILALVGANVITSKTGNILKNCYCVYLRRSLDLKLMDRPVLANQTELLEQRQQVKLVWEQTFG
jgi:glutamate-ammonia-ligase adenylyltransferase